MQPKNSNRPGHYSDPDPLVEKLVSDLSELPKLIVLTGWLGLSDRKGQWRLYTNPNMNDFVEFKGEDVCHCERQEKESPVSGSMVWLRASTEVVYTRRTTTAIEGEFLQGRVIQTLPLSNIALGTAIRRFGGTGFGAVDTWNCQIRTAGTCSLVLCTRVEECQISREANPCA
jgi:hypothetical protein